MTLAHLFLVQKSFVWVSASPTFMRTPWHQRLSLKIVTDHCSCKVKDISSGCTRISRRPFKEDDKSLLMVQNVSERPGSFFNVTVFRVPDTLCTSSWAPFSAGCRVQEPPAFRCLLREESCEIPQGQEGLFNTSIAPVPAKTQQNPQSDFVIKTWC